MVLADDDDVTIVAKQTQNRISNTRHCPRCGLAVGESTSVCPQDGTQIYEAQEQLLAQKYEFISVTGAGGMSVVYKAERLEDRQIVAIKMLHSLLINDQSLKRFQQEAKAIMSLEHPNIISVHDFGVSEHGQPYMVMDYIDGNTLADVIKERGGLSLEDSLHRFIQLCDALEHAHESGVLHRDLKPSNIMISNRDGNFADARIVDFGIAKLLDKDGEREDAGHLTQTGELFGSPLYMSPEQCRGQHVDARTDIYSMGCVMYETLTGKPPLKGNSIIETIFLQMNEPPLPMSVVCPNRQFPEALEVVIAKSLAKEPGERYQTMTELEYALMQIQPNQSDGSYRQKIRRAKAAFKLSKTATVAIGCTLLGFIIAGFAIPPVLQYQRENSNERKFVDIARPATNPSVDVPLLADRLRKLGNKEKMDDKVLLECLGAGDIGATKVDFSSLPNELTDNSARLLGKLRSLKELDLDWNKNLGNETLQAIESLTKLSKLSLRGTRIDDAGICNYLPHLAASLKELRVSDTNIGAASIEAIAQKLPKIKKLSLSNIYRPFSDQSFAKLAALNLEELHAEGTTVGDGGITALSDTKSLNDLQLAGTKVTDNGVKSLSNLSNLQKLGLNHTSITDSAMGSLENLHQLKDLRLGDTNITNAKMPTVGKFEELEILDLHDTRVSDKGLAPLSNLKKLWSLNLANDDISDSSIDVFNKMPKLWMLDLGGTKITDSGLAKLKAEWMHELILVGCPNLTLNGIRNFVAKHKNVIVRVVPVGKEDEGFWDDFRN